MVQATTWSVPLSGPVTPSAMATRIDDSLDAQLSMHSGTAEPSYKVAGTQWLDNSASPWVVKVYDGTDWIPLYYVDSTNNEITPYGQVLAQSRLVFASTTQIRLDRYDGKKLFINGKNEIVPSAGVTLANTSIGASVLRYIYAFMSGTTMTLEASATAYATDTTYGHKIKSGDATRTLVGMIRTDSSGLFADSATNIGVASYFNRRARRVFVEGSALSTTSTTQVASGLLITILNWADEIVQPTCTGLSQCSTTASTSAQLQTDGAGFGQLSQTYSAISAASGAVSLGEPLTPAEGYHTYGVSVSTNSGTGTFYLNLSAVTRI